MTHASVVDSPLAVREDLIRLSVGIEDVADLIADLLRDLMERDRDSLLGPAAAAYPVFPWLIKYLDCHDWLSVQVHPDEAAVRRLWPGEGSKTEAWFVLDAAPGTPCPECIPETQQPEQQALWSVSTALVVWILSVGFLFFFQGVELGLNSVYDSHM